MAKLVTFGVYDLALAPKNAGTLTFKYYGTRLGVARPPPTITMAAGTGCYQFLPSDADEAIGCVWVVETGWYPGVVGGAIFIDSEPFFAHIFRLPDGSFYTGLSVPTFERWADLAGGDQLGTAPTILGVDDGTGDKVAFIFSPSPTDIANGRQWLLKAIAGQTPAYYRGDVQALGIVADIIPPVVTMLTGSALTPTSPINLQVTDNILLRRVVLMVKMDGAWEVVSDGDNFAPGYIGSSRTVVAGGYLYSCVRSGGWPDGDMQFEVIAGDTAGNEA